MTSSYFFAMKFWDQIKTLNDGNQFAAKLKAKRSSILGKNRIDILYYLNTRNINLENVIEIINEAHFTSKSKTKANWIIVGSGAGIYLFEELASRKYQKVKNWRNAFCTIDVDNGKTFFDLKSNENLSISIEMEYLIQNANGFSKEDYSIELANIRGRIFSNMKY